MNIEDCKEGAKVRWGFDGDTDEGIIVKHKGSIWQDYIKNRVWVIWDSYSHEPLHAELENLTLIEPPKQEEERTYTKEEIIEYLAYKDCHVAVSKIVEGLYEYFSPSNNAEREAIKLLKSKGYTVQK